jgi:LAO/AO transport system kinase
MLENSASYLTEKLLSGDRAALSRAITLAESVKPEHRKTADDILGAVMSRTGKSRRIGISGIPGAGKSTFIEYYGCQLCEAGHKVAVLAVDPSGLVSRGSILGDKTRMEKLAGMENAFIRPTPSGHVLGGVAAGTADAILLCEAAGYDTILIETVGVGQSETAVKNMTDIFVLLVISGAGDELQGIKRGIMEATDLVLVNKADSGTEKAAEETAQNLRNALHFFPHRESPGEIPVICISSIQGTGIASFAEEINHFFSFLLEANRLEDKRNRQNLSRFSEMVKNLILKNTLREESISALIQELNSGVQSGELSGLSAAVHFDTFFKNRFNL